MKKLAILAILISALSSKVEAQTVPTDISGYQVFVENCYVQGFDRVFPGNAFNYNAKLTIARLIIAWNHDSIDQDRVMRYHRDQEHCTSEAHLIAYGAWNSLNLLERGLVETLLVLVNDSID